MTPPSSCQVGGSNHARWHKYRAPMMQTNLLRGALKRHALGASARLGSGVGDISAALRIGRSRGNRNLSSVVAVRDDDDDDDGTAAAATAAVVAQVRAAVNGAVKKRGPSFAATSNKERQKEKSSPSPCSSVKDEEIKKNYLNQIHSDDEEHVSPTHLKYTGGQSMPLTSTLKIVEPGEDAPRGIWPVYRILDEDGCFRCPSNDGYIDPEMPAITPITASSSAEEMIPRSNDDDDEKHNLSRLRSILSSKHPLHSSEVQDSTLLQPSSSPYADTGTNNTLLRAQRQMIRLRQMDNIMQNAQRQGRISFYMTCRGEEAIHIGSAAALRPQDIILAQYREHGLLMWRGFTLEQFTNQCFSNDLDLGRGRQMPIHYGSRALNYHTISSPLGTQIPQATGVAYKMKLDAAAAAANGDSNHDPGIAICYFGDGCASTTDFHAGLNFAATLKAPAIFFCRNNGYAISTSVEDQYAGDGIVCRAIGYGMAGLRVDGNDIFAVNAAVREAREYCLTHNAPILIEAMTYRQGHHSTSDDSSRYRCPKEVHSHSTSTDPVKRLNAFLERNEWMSADGTAKIRDEERMAVLQAMEAAERRPPPKMETLFTDVYELMPQHLQRQERQLHDHLAKYPDNY